MKGYKGIPAKYRKAVSLYIKTSDHKASPQAAYAKLSAWWQQQRDEKAAKDAADLKAILDAQRNGSINDVAESIRALAVVRDVLASLGDQNSGFSGIDPHDIAAMAHAYMDKMGAQLESALYLLDIAEPHAKAKHGGWLAESFPTKILNK